MSAEENGGNDGDNVTILRPDGKPVKPDVRKGQLLLYRKMIDLCNYFAAEVGLNPFEILGVCSHVVNDIYGASVRMNQARAAEMAAQQNNGEEPPPSSPIIS